MKHVTTKNSIQISTLQLNRKNVIKELIRKMFAHKNIFNIIEICEIKEKNRLPDVQS